MEINKIYQGNSLEVLKTFPDESIDTCVTSPPYYGLRDYGMDGQVGLEETPDEFIKSLVEIFSEVKRVLKKEGTLWVNMGDSYAGGGGLNGIPDDWNSISVSNRQKYPNHNDPKRNAKKIGYKKKDLMGIPWLLAFALQKDGWYLRQDIIWHKPNPMPESVTDRCTKNHEYIFLLSKNPMYYFDNESIKEPAKPDKSLRDRDNTKMNNTPGRTKMGGLKTNHYTMKNKRSVWTVTTKPYKEAHFATYPEDLIEPCILAGCPEGGVVLDPFMGAGTTGVVSIQNRRNYVGIELNPEYIEIAEKRLQPVQEKQDQLEYKEEILGKFFDI
jgi:DNA modification methylase